MTQRQWLEAAFVDPQSAESGGATSIEAQNRDLYDRLALAARMGGEEPSEFEREVGELLFLDALDEMLSSETEPAKPTTPEMPGESGQNSRGRILALVASALLAVGGIYFATQILQPDDEFQARSAATQTQPYGHVQVHVYCARPHANEVRFILPQKEKCRLSDQLKLAYTNADPALKWGYFFGVAEDGKVLWYGPTPELTTPIELKRDPKGHPVPFGETIRLNVNHTSGPVTVLGVFAEEKLPWQVYRDWASRAAKDVLRGQEPGLDRAAVSVAEFQVEAE